MTARSQPGSLWRDAEVSATHRKSSRKRLARAEAHHRKLVHVRETTPPDGEKAVEWFLLTSIDVDSFETAIEVI